MKTISKYTLPILAGFGLLILLIFVLSMAAAKSIQQPPTSPTMKFSDEMTELRRVLESKDLDPDVRDSVERKLEMAQRKATIEALRPGSATIWAQKQTAIIEATLIPLATSAPQATRITGIILNPPPTGISSADRFSSVWIQKFENSYARFYAGYKLNDPDQGILIVVIETPYSMTRFEVPGKTGSLEIKGLVGELLTITAVNDQSFLFSINTYKLFDNETGEEIRLSTGQSSSQNATAYP